MSKISVFSRPTSTPCVQPFLLKNFMNLKQVKISLSLLVIVDVIFNEATYIPYPHGFLATYDLSAVT